MAVPGVENKYKVLQRDQVISTSLHGDFKVKQLIAFGRCCVAYMAQKVTDGSPDDEMFVTVKFFRRHQDYRGALAREKRILAALNGDKHIVNHFCHVLTRFGQDVLVQELLSGTVGHIWSELKHDESTASPWLLHTLCLHAAIGLRSMHGSGFVHGDVKSHNIMWSADRAAFVLIDFGLSATVEEEFKHKMHSPEYSAPEVLLWNQSLDEQQEIPQQANTGECESEHESTDEREKLLPTAEAVQRHKQPEVPPRPGQPSDVWALGCTVLKLSLLGERVFPNGVPGAQRTLDALIDSRIAAAAALAGYDAAFVQMFALYIKSCFRIKPSERATAHQLCSTAYNNIQPGLMPSYEDLFLLPTAVLRISNLDVPSSENGVADTGGADDTARLIAKFRLFGPITRHWRCPTTGDLYLEYIASVHAETAYQNLDDKEWRHRTLVLAFYPPYLLREKIVEAAKAAAGGGGGGGATSDDKSSGEKK